MPTKTFAPFERLLSSDLNLYVMEQVVAIFVDAAARDAALLAPVNGQAAYLTGLDILTVFDGAAWRSIGLGGGAFASLTHNATQSIPNTTLTKITLATVAEDSRGFALGSSELTVPAGLGGLYQLFGQLFWATQTTVVGYRDAHIKVGAVTAVRAIQSQGTASIAAIQSIGGLYRLAAGDVVSLHGGHTHGVAINSTNDTFAPRLSIARVGD